MSFGETITEITRQILGTIPASLPGVTAIALVLDDEPWSATVVASVSAVSWLMAAALRRNQPVEIETPESPDFVASETAPKAASSLEDG